jgi:hypothetical protein
LNLKAEAAAIKTSKLIENISYTHFFCLANAI